ncbi:MAG: hypothetical protein J1E03_13155 [Acetatifactor sp.]|nr:hypothetical protein [Acetatifactor sp.]
MLRQEECKSSILPARCYYNLWEAALTTVSHEFVSAVMSQVTVLARICGFPE